MALTTEKLCGILTAFGGNPANLPDMLDVTIIDAIVEKLDADDMVNAERVLAAIQAMNDTQKAAVKTALGIT